jgi:CubicO group peptidase (beta-lactamase class C family)
MAGGWAGVAAVALALSSGVAHAQLAAPAATSGEITSESLAPELRAELDSYIRDALLAFDVPGAAVAVLEGGRVAYRGAFGVRGDGRSRAIDTRTLFMVGSITKSMTSTMIATLVDDGVLGWDASVERLLPTFDLVTPEHEARVTLRHLLSHQSGLSRSDVSLFLGGDAPLGLIEEVSTIPMHSAPGERYEYQNQAYSLAGFAAARAAGARYTNHGLYRTYERLMQGRVFEPVGMRRTTLDFERVLRSDNHAWPNEYSALSGDVDPVQFGYERFAKTVAPAGAVWSNIDEMARYALLHLSRGVNASGQRVVSEAGIEETHTPRVAAEGGGYGLGWIVADGPLGRLVTHSGGTAGFGADLALLPERGWGVVVLTNRASSFPFIQSVERYVLEVLLGLERTPDSDLLALEQALRDELAALMALTTEALPADVAPFLGAYEDNVRFVHRGPDLVLRNEFGELTLRAVVGFPGAFLVVGNTLGGAVAQFSSDSAGNVSVTVGLPFVEGEDVQLLQPVTLAKLQRRPHSHRPHRWLSDPRAEWHRVVRYLRDCGLKAPRSDPAPSRLGYPGSWARHRAR